MSVAYELFPATDPAADPAGTAPSRQVPPRLFLVPPVSDPRPGRLRSAPPAAAGVAVLLPPVDTPPARLTRRGVVVVAIATAIVAAAVVVLAALSARSAGSGGTSGAGAADSGPAVVTVHAGDTLWSIASANAPGTDPRAEVAALQRLNHVSGESLVPGQRLRLR